MGSWSTSSRERSRGGTTHLNIRQIRLWQDVDYYICRYIDEIDFSKSWCFKLTKAEIEAEVAAHGSYTHGTKATATDSEKNEYSMTVGVKKAKEWRKKYWYDDLYKKLCS